MANLRGPGTSITAAAASDDKDGEDSQSQVTPLKLSHTTDPNSPLFRPVYFEREPDGPGNDYVLCDHRFPRGFLTPDVDQHGLPICWAAAIVMCLEAMLRQFYRLDVKLSVQELIDYYSGNVADGGDVISSLNYIMRNGITFEENYPYTGQLSKHLIPPDTPKGDRIFPLSRTYGYTEISKERDTALWNLKSPVLGGVNTNADFFRIYPDDLLAWDIIYPRPGDMQFGRQDHLVALGGFGFEDGGSKRFEKDHKVNYWIFQNNLGRDWRRNGCGRLLRCDQRNVVEAYILHLRPVEELYTFIR